MRSLRGARETGRSRTAHTSEGVIRPSVGPGLKLQGLMDKIIKAGAATAAILTSVLILLIVANIVYRQVFVTFLGFERILFTFVPEYTGFALLIMVYLGVAEAIHSDTMIRVELITRQFLPSRRVFFDLINGLVTLGLSGLMLFYALGWYFLVLETGLKSPGMSRTPLWIPYSLALAGMTLVLISATYYVIRKAIATARRVGTQSHAGEES